MFFDRDDVTGNLDRTEKAVLARWAYQNNGQRLHIPGLGNIFGHFFFEFSKGNVLNIHLKELRNTLKRRKCLSKT